MNQDKATVILRIFSRRFETDLELPLDISANELVTALNSSYDLGMDVSDVKNCYLKSENPIALLKGNKPLYEFGVHNGTIINVTD